MICLLTNLSVCVSGTSINLEEILMCLLHPTKILIYSIWLRILKPSVPFKNSFQIQSSLLPPPADEGGPGERLREES